MTVQNETSQQLPIMIIMIITHHEQSHAIIARQPSVNNQTGQNNPDLEVMVNYSLTYCSTLLQN